MNVTYNSKFNLPWVILHPGDYYATNKPELVSTLLGSCIAVVLIDEKSPVAGMNHFMLPAAGNARALFGDDGGRYGTYAMDLLINAMMKLGANRKTFSAKIFGGGHMLGKTSGREVRSFTSKKAGTLSFGDDVKGTSIPESNIRFILDYLDAERIPLLSHDLGGNLGRKIFFFSETRKVLLAHLREQTSLSTLIKEELAYLQKVKRGIKKSGDTDVVLFGK